MVEGVPLAVVRPHRRWRRILALFGGLMFILLAIGYIFGPAPRDPSSYCRQGYHPVIYCAPHYGETLPIKTTPNLRPYKP
jgi:hypothetical protein